MIDAKHARIAHVVAQALNVVTVAVGADPLGVDGSETPVLAGGEKAVRRRATRDAECEGVGLAPNVEASGVHPERQIKIEPG